MARNHFNLFRWPFFILTLRNSSIYGNIFILLSIYSFYQCNFGISIFIIHHHYFLVPCRFSSRLALFWFLFNFLFFNWRLRPAFLFASTSRCTVSQCSSLCLLMNVLQFFLELLALLLNTFFKIFIKISVKNMLDIVFKAYLSERLTIIILHSSWSFSFGWFSSGNFFALLFWQVQVCRCLIVLIFHFLSNGEIHLAKFVIGVLLNLRCCSVCLWVVKVLLPIKSSNGSSFQQL